jgi:hypothetical protein
MHFYWLILGILSVWRITHLLYGEDGPWDIFVRLRKLAGRSFWGKLLDCFYCLSLWISVPFAYFIGESWKERGLLWLAFSGGAIVLEKLTNHNLTFPAEYREDEEKKDGVLRRQEEKVLRKPDQPGDK